MFYVYGFSLEGGETRERKGEDTTRTGDHVPEVLTNSVAQSRPGRSMSSVATRALMPVL